MGLGKSETAIMAHNPSFVGKTHVVTYHDEDGNVSVIGVHGNYGSARQHADQHATERANYMTAKSEHKVTLKRSKVGENEHVYHHPGENVDQLPEHYEIHREGKSQEFDKV